MQLFSADSTIFLKDFKNSFAPETMENPISKVGHHWPIFFFSITNRPKTRTNLNFSSSKIAHRVSYLYVITLDTTDSNLSQSDTKWH